MTSFVRNRSRPYGPIPIKGSRTRTTYNYVGGNLISQGTTVTSTGGNYPMGQEVCIDSVSNVTPYPDHDLTLTKRYLRAGLVNGVCMQPPAKPNTGTQIVDVYSNWSTPRIGSSSNTGLPILPAVSFPYWETKALAGINPARPILDLPLFLFELKDFPRMLRDLGRILQKRVRPSDIPGGFLAYRFGWAPLIKDAMSLLDLTLQIENRIKHLRSGKGGEYVSRTLSVRNERPYSSTTLTPISLTSPSRSMIIKVESSYEEKVWYTGRFKISPSDSATLELLLRTPSSERTRFVLGLNGVSASTIWNAIPWSWLSDYLTNIGDILDARRGFISFSLTGVNLMCHQQLEERSTISSDTTGLTFTPHRFLLEAKLRSAINVATPKVAFRPFLTGGQTAILGALVTASALRQIRL